jgi:hypothetical protein
VFKRCPYCHKWQFAFMYTSHIKKHTKTRPDGQQQDHLTAPPEERYSGSLDGVPQAYMHLVCGTVTGMPEEIIRTYLVNPMSYGDGSFCCGCGEYVDGSQLVWVETGQTLTDYMGPKRLNYLRKVCRYQVPDRPETLFVTPHASLEFLKHLKSLQRDAPIAIAFNIPKPPESTYTLGFTSAMNRETHFQTRIDGIPFVMPLHAKDRLSGLVIHFVRKPHDAFVIFRLYAVE